MKQHPVVEKSMTRIVSLMSVNGTEVVKLADLDAPRRTLTPNLKNRNTIFSNFFLSEYTRKHDTVNGNPNHRTLLNLTRL